MAQINVTLRLSFASGEEQVQSVKSQVPTPESQVALEPAPAPYRMPTQTAPGEPTLVESITFPKLD